MKLCITQSISNLPNVFPSNPPFLRLRHAQIPPLRNRMKRSLGVCICHSSSVPRASFNEESSIGSSSYATEEVDRTVVVETDSPIENKAFAESPATETEVTNEESPVNEQVIEFLDNINIKFDSDDTYSLLLLGGGAVVALWLASAVVGAIDSIPLFPKLMEVVGLGYTFWFTTRYLLFKENREELYAKVEELKQQVIGSSSD